VADLEAAAERPGPLAWAWLAAPALLFAGIDFVCRLRLATQLELHHRSDMQVAALSAALLGVAKDLPLLLLAYGIYALWPGRVSRGLAHACLAASFVILLGDVAYFHFTLEHIEPVLFVNLNWLAIRGTLGDAGLLLLLPAAGLLWILVRFDARLLAKVGPPLGVRRALPLVLGLVAVGAGPLVVVHQPRMPEGSEGVEEFLNKGRDAYLRSVAAPILANFFASAWEGRHIEAERKVTFAAYTPAEAQVLRGLGLLDADAPGAAPSPAAVPEIKRIALLILESLPAAYLHTYNPTVPAEATSFFDALLATHPHLDHFYTSNTPSDWGLNSLLLSRLRPAWEGGWPSLLSLLREERGFRSYYVRGVSKHYGNELQTYTRLFQMDDYYALEELSARYDSSWHSAWGFNNRVVYEEGLRILREHRDDKVIVVLKTIDLHQPGPFQGVPRKYLPEALARLDVGLFNALYWVDRCLRAFFTQLEEGGLYDEHTLVIVTSDHSPHPGLAYRETVPPDEYVRLGRLPLILATPHPSLFERLDTNRLASQVDIAPTLLDALGVAKPPGMIGRSLLDAEGTPGVAVGAYRDTFYYRSAAGSFTSDLSSRDDLRSAAIAKWVSNLDVERDRRVATR